MKFRRNKAARAEDAVEPEETAADVPAGPRARGPWDRSEVTIEDDDQTRIDLGCLLVRPPEDLDVQLQVDEGSGEVAAVLLVGQEGAAELKVFAAPRNGDIWTDLRRSLVGEVARMGGTATEAEGTWGPELVVSLMVELPEGGHAQQISRIVGIAGPRWLLRVTMFGRPAVEYREDGDVETALRELVVVRGGSPVPPGDPLPLTLPPQAQRVDPQAG